MFLDKYKSDVMANPGSKEASTTLNDLVDLEIKLTWGLEDVEIQRGIVSMLLILSEKS